jgi:N-acetylmuramoyl-L-alanine amidase
MDYEHLPEQRTGFGKRFRDIVRHIGTVLVVGMVVATAFTLWTPASILPRSAARDIARAMATRVGRNASPMPPTHTPKPREIVGIVAGHSGNDSGAVCPDGLTEAEINLDIAEQVENILYSEGYDVDILTEFDDRLDNYAASALVSIHADSCNYINEQATGYKVTASLETQIPEESNRLVSCIIGRYSAATEMKFHAGSITYDMEYYHAFREVNANTPAAIIEVGFMNLDRDMITNNSSTVAQGVANGILCYVRNESLGIEE